MALLPPAFTHLVVRWVHVLGMAGLFGGAVLAWGLLRGREAHERPAATLAAAATYEWLFWAAAGLVVLTGVGNLGAMAPAIPGPGTIWGVAFSTKLVGLLALLVGSAVRTLGVLRLRAYPDRTPPAEAVARLRQSYAATAILLLLVVALAEVIAHG